MGLIGVLLIASPVLGYILEDLPAGEAFSELYVLGPDEMAQGMPFNIVVNQDYTVYLGVGNHLGASTYYVCYLKLQNQTDALPNEETQTPSSLPSIYEYRALIKDNTNWMVPLNFSITDVSAANHQLLIQNININGEVFTVNKIAQFDQDNSGYYYQILIELWAFNPDLDTLQYQNRYVYFWLKLTSTVDAL
ncbi:MAG: DUF1616 domain-containing protein [Candidatus Bathyarchaeota archaeon]|nr:DUF1616 domain-containing protein [Candidatus Bathyarchaeota archaeon]